MKFHFCLEQVPELSGLSKNERRAALMYYHANQPATSSSRAKENALVGTIIFAEIAGFVGGFILWDNSSWGPVLGCTIALAFVMCVFHFVSLCFVVPKFRRFLQAGHSQLFLRSLRMAGVAPAAATPLPQEKAAQILRQYRTQESTSMGEDELASVLKRITCDAARSTEVMELSEELAKESLRLFNAVQQKHHDAWKALRSVRLGRFLRLSREGAALQVQALRLLRQSGELLQGAESAIGVAAALLEEIRKGLNNDAC